MPRGDDVPEKLTVILIVRLLRKACDLERIGDDPKLPSALGRAAGTRHGVDGRRLRELKRGETLVDDKKMSGRLL